ncbi:NAD(P)-binding domain-containing protein [Pseudomonas aeruginosa]|uniref:NAD(P)-binding domain-containing protein n=1 Tax=Pseudomonas aeruginosa TaxID=287 RepID=UPI003B67B87D
MGYPMAGHLQREGYDVCVYNRSSAKALRWVEEYAGRRADTPRRYAARGLCWRRAGVLLRR